MSLPAEIHAETRAAFEEAFDAICPNVRDNPFIPHFPLPAQTILLGLHQQPQFAGKTCVALYGGAAGGGKSDALLMAAAQYATEPDYAGILFRRTHTDLAQPGALIDRSHSWWYGKGPHWDGTNKIWRFPSGAKIAMAYLAKDTDKNRYQSAQYQFTGWDELTHFPEQGPFEYVGLSRVRRGANAAIPLRTFAASNPGGPGHAWVKCAFMGGPDPHTGQHRDARYAYIPARIKDNPYIDQEPYIDSLSRLHPTARDQLLNGDWDARMPGDYFRREWFGPLLDPEKDVWPDSECVRIRWWDLAASEKEDAAFTSGVRMARHRKGVRAIEHCRSFRATPGKRDDLIVQQAQADGRAVTVGLEIEGGSGGQAQFDALEKRLRAQGFRVVGARPAHMKLSELETRQIVRNSPSLVAKCSRADPVASCLERGYQRRGECPDTGAPWWGEDEGLGVQDQRDGIRLFAGRWTQSYLDVVEGFPDGATCDEVDATSGAWAWLELHGFGGRLPVAPRRAEVETVEMAQLHPSDRERVNRRRRSRFYAP